MGVRGCGEGEMWPAIRAFAHSRIRDLFADGDPLADGSPFADGALPNLARVPRCGTLGNGGWGHRGKSGHPQRRERDIGT